MTRVPVKSSNLRSVGYDEATRTLEVEFHSGAVHHYANVPSSTHTELVAHKSPGSYFHKHVRDKFTNRAM